MPLTGELLIVISEGKLKPTDVTVPVVELVPAPIAVLKEEASKAEIVLSGVYP